MIKFKYIEVLKSKDNFHYVAWEMGTDTPPVFPPLPEESPKNYTYMVYWSNNEKSGYHSIKDDDGNDVVIDGDSLTQLGVMHKRKHNNFNNKYFYVIVAYSKLNPLVGLKSEPVYFGQFHDGIHVQIKHAEATLYDMYYGEPSLLVTRKPYGEPCTSCWSVERQQRTKSNCPVCNNTGKVYGYYQPIKVQMSYDSDPVSSQVTHSAEVVQDTKRGRISNYPIVKPRDLIINTDDNKRYTITHVETTKLPLRAVADNDPHREVYDKKLSRQNYVVSQMLTLQEIPADDQEYYMNYDEIPSDCDDYSLPRFQTHEPATGGDGIDVDEHQVVSLKYGSDFTIDPVTNELKLENPLDKIGELEVNYSLLSGINSIAVIPNVNMSLTPSTPGIEIELGSILISVDSASDLGLSANNASVNLVEYDGDTEYHAGDIIPIFSKDFAINDPANPSVKYYQYYTVTPDTTTACPPINSGKRLIVEVNPNGGWTFDKIRVTVKLKLKVI